MDSRPCDRDPDGTAGLVQYNHRHHSSFLVTDDVTESVFVLDTRGFLRHRIKPPADKARGALIDCAVTGSGWDIARELLLSCLSDSVEYIHKRPYIAPALTYYSQSMLVI